MAEANISLALDQFNCPICLDLLKDPVTLQCGHSFCMKCINDCWYQKGVYRCPQCRHTFTPRPVVRKNTILTEVLETLKKTRLQATHPAHRLTEDVECDFCTERKHKAIKSCLVCLASFCETHLQPHYKSPAFKKHKLVETSRRLQEQICSQHDKLLEVYCRTDQQCICMLCTMDQHKGHDTVSAAAERAEKQKQLLEFQVKSRQKIQEREKEIRELEKAVKTHKQSAQTAVQETESIFIKLIKSIEKRCSEVKELIGAQEKVVVSQAAEVMKQLGQEIAELKKRNTEIDGLLHSGDSIFVVQSSHSLVTPAGAADLPITVINSFLYFEEAIKTVSQLQERLEACFKEQSKKISSEVKKVLILPPQSREECLQYSCQLTLDPNTAHGRLQLANLNRMATETFKYHSQVLCRESVSEPCYWEVELSGDNGGCIAVSYKDISRNGSANDLMFGRNDKSWNLLCSSSCSFLHNNQQTNISMNLTCSKIGVFLDHKAGNLSFYSVSDTMKLLHRVQTKFTQPLYPGFGLNRYSTIKLC